uniref:RING-type domain-containing protein n=1 Tax=Clastoptera arizonana TaxID=38151 RepID=A0A1B6EFY9_9HEMI
MKNVLIFFNKKTANCRIQSFEDRVFCYDHRFVKKLMYPLLRIRQACSHHQAVRGQFVNIKDTMTMDELLVNLTDKVKTQCEEMLRSLVSVINGISGLYYVQDEYLKAVESYREVLHLIQEYKHKLKVDSLQKVHVLHNLAEILENHPGIAPPTLRDENLRSDLAELEWKYVNKRELSMTNCKTSLDKCKEYISDLCKSRPLGFSEWWLDVLERTIDQDKLLGKILMSLERTDIYHQHQHKSLARKLHNLINVRQELAKWLADLDSARERILVSVQSLCDTPREDLASKAAICHISPNQSTKKTKCQLCKFEAALAQYGALIFEQKNSAISKKTQDKNESHSIIQKGKSIIDLMNVNLKTLDVIEKGGLKTSQHERVLIELRNHCRAKHMHSEIIEDATQHMNVLKYVKREFLHVSNFWTLMSQQVCCQDELNMAKIRFQLALPTDEVDKLSPRKKLEMKEKKYIIDASEVPTELLSYQKTKEEVQQNLKSKLGTLLYLENLKNEDNDSKTCPICRNNLIYKWTVLTCGHCICIECLPQLLKHSNTSISCVQCRQPCKIKDLSYADNTKSGETNLKGSYSTKIEAVMIEILKLREADPLVKVLIFSSWDKVLDVLGESFIKNDISFRKMSGRKLKASLEDFKTKRVTALLMSLRIGAKGLNLVEATHVFLVEPILDPSEELQAIGRVHRIGQTKNTFVHRFITKNTVEERMMSALEGDSNEPFKWKKENITLKQLYDLFTGYDNNTSNSHSHENNPDSPIIDDEVIIE